MAMNIGARTPVTPPTEGQAPYLALSREGFVLRVVLARPKSRNSLSEGMMAALSQALADGATNASVRAIVIAAEGHVFSAGHDLKELTARRADADRGRAYFADIMGRCSALMQAIVNHPKPIIAEVGGIATAAGCQLVASCDLAIASIHAQFQTPGVHIGLFCSTPMVAVSRAIGRKHALEMLLTGDMIPAERAVEMGLVNRVVPAEELTGEAMALAARIASKSPLTLKIGKEAFQRQLDLPLTDAYRVAAEIMVENMLARDAEEGIGAFLGKREPRWEGR
jgi:enoyl-CoA hydratase/carnithine racemase